LNEAIRRWQENLGKSPAFKADNLEELASHLRASVQKLKATGISEEEAFQIATRRIGEHGALEREFAKTNPFATWSLPLILFWIVAGIYVFQVVFSLVCGILVLRHTLEMRDFQRLVVLRTSTLDQVYQAFSSHYDPPLSFAPTLSIVMVLVFILGVRWAVGSWRGFGAFLRSFEHPIRTALGLVVLGNVAIHLPHILSGFQMDGVWDNLADLPVVNDVLVLVMVFLARRGLRKTAPMDGNCSQSYENPNPG